MATSTTVLLKRTNKTRKQRMDQICLILARNPAGMPTRMLAKFAGITDSPYLRGILNDLVKEGKIQVNYTIWINGTRKAHYRATPGKLNTTWEK